MNVTANHTITGSGTVSGGCDDDFDPCLNPGLISGATGVTLTLDPGTEAMRFNECLHFAVPLDIQSRVDFRLTVAHQVLEFDGQVDGPGDITFYQGTVKVNACMRLTGPAGKFDFGYVTGGTDLPELIINARTCTEAPFAFDNGTLEANANFRVKSSIFSIGSLCFADPEEEGGNCLSNGDVVFEVAPNRNVVFDGTDGTCPACP